MHLSATILKAFAIEIVHAIDCVCVFLRLSIHACTHAQEMITSLVPPHPTHPPLAQAH